MVKQNSPSYIMFNHSAINRSVFLIGLLFHFSFIYLLRFDNLFIFYFRPANPIEFLAAYLLKNKDKFQ